jgi:hypothetical protein
MTLRRVTELAALFPDRQNIVAVAFGSQCDPRQQNCRRFSLCIRACFHAHRKVDRAMSGREQSFSKVAVSAFGIDELAIGRDAD